MTEAIYSTAKVGRHAANDEVMSASVEPLSADDYHNLMALLSKARDWFNHDREKQAVKALEVEDEKKADGQERGILTPALMESSSKDDVIIPWYITRQELCHMFGYGNNVKNFMAMLSHFPDHPPFFHRGPIGTVLSERNAWIEWCRKYQIKDSKSLADFRDLFKWISAHKIKKVTQLEDLALQAHSFGELYEMAEVLTAWFILTLNFLITGSFSISEKIGAEND